LKQVGHSEMKRLGQTFIVTDYWDDLFLHRPYEGVLHGNDDKPVRDEDVIAQALKAARVKDGDEVVVLVLKTGRRPFGSARTRWVAPHRYEREMVKESRNGKER
jgi:hypothetical protein